MLLHVLKSRKGMNAKCLNDMLSVKQINYSMRQDVKLVQPRRKTTTVGLKTVSYFGAKLWNDNVVLCNELWNEDFLTFKHTVNDSNLDIIIYDDFKYSWKPTSVLLILICCLTTSMFYPSSSFNTCSIIELWMILWNIFNDLSLTLLYVLIYIYIYIYMCVCICVSVYIYIYSFNIMAFFRSLCYILY